MKRETQLDREGFDRSILRSMITDCQCYPQAFPREIAFEANLVTDLGEVNAIIEELITNGYEVRVHECGRRWRG